MVGGDDVDGAVGQSTAKRLHVLVPPQRRVHFEPRVVGAGQVFGQQQVMRRRLRRHIDAAGLSPAHDLDRSGGGHVADVQSRADVLGEKNVPRDDGLLGDRGPAGETELTRQGALVHLCVLGESWLLRVLRDHSPERLHVLEGATHEQGVRDAPAIVGEDGDLRARTRHGADLAESFTRETHRHCADRPHGDIAVLGAQRVHLLDHARGIGDRRGVGHRVHGGEAAGSGRPGAGQNRLALLVARLAQVRVEVDEAGKRCESGCVDRGRPRAGLRGEPAVRDEEVAGGAIGACRTRDHQVHSAPPSLASSR